MSHDPANIRPEGYFLLLSMSCCPGRTALCLGAVTVEASQGSGQGPETSALRLCILVPSGFLSPALHNIRWTGVTYISSRSLSSEDLVKTFKPILKVYREELKTEKLTLTSQKEVEYFSGLYVARACFDHITTHTTFATPGVIEDNDM